MNTIIKEILVGNETTVLVHHARIRGIAKNPTIEFIGIQARSSTFGCSEKVGK